MRTSRVLLGLACAAGAVLAMAAAPPKRVGVVRFGSQGKVAAAGAVPLAEPQMPHGPVVDRLRKALDVTMDLSFDDVDPKDFRLGAVLDTLERRTKLAFLAPRAIDGEDKIELKPFVCNRELSVAAFLAFLDDHINEERPVVTFIVREYGLRAVPPSRVPAGAMTLREFRKRQPRIGGAE